MDNQQLERITLTYSEAAKTIRVSADAIPLLVEAGLIKPLRFKRPKISTYELKRFVIETAAAGIDIEATLEQLRLDKKTKKMQEVG
ncbi:hypothetical protein QN289_03875 [Latilactobacillus curvatus]|uniref:hypothetical protein n=1 Tax=Latilactobacillus curvatus TaxID=28038 RepID=UPI0024DF4788|nr:hypothetical protein [Latilactobacillus curvatus]WIE01505.1 hypothetical protein QN289_03875 [Latilactobacillus curvatus]